MEKQAVGTVVTPAKSCKIFTEEQVREVANYDSDPEMAGAVYTHCEGCSICNTIFTAARRKVKMD